MSSNITPAISIVVPVYKAEKYIYRCIDSILNQTFKNFELILVDDGSPDKSGIICDDYAKKDDRVTVIHKKNGGVASARQEGINRVIGEYTIHADPDDWMELDMLECMYNTIKETNADLLITDFYFNKKSEETYIKQPITSLDQEDILKGILADLHGGLWNKLLKTKVYKDNNIQFIDGINLYEDNIFWVQVLQVHNIKISYLSKAFYHYDLSSNVNSITKNGYKKMAVSMERYLYYLETLISDKYKSEREISQLDTLAYIFFAGIPIKNYRYYYKRLKKHLNDTHWSGINKVFFRMSYYNKPFAYFIYRIKRNIHFFMKDMLSNRSN